MGRPHFCSLPLIQNPMFTAGYFASILIGISLGLIGGGGSILTVPVLVYLFGTDAVLATAYSLFIVGITSVFGSVSYFRKGLVNLKTAFVFGVPAVAAVFVTRSYVLPAIPPEIASIGSFTLTRDNLLLLLFAVLMVFASHSMIKKSPPPPVVPGPENTGSPSLSMLAGGLAIGTLTGLIGAGGGFLIIPALVNGLKMPVKAAIGTSLVIIAINSLTGFLFSLSGTAINWSFLLTIAGIAIGGVLIGSYLSARIEGANLKPAFGWFVLAMGLYILARETVFN